MRINTNVSSLNTLRQLGVASRGFSSSVQKLSSGFRINKAADDAAGLGIANKIRADVRSMSQASRNAEQATSLLQVAEGGAQTISSIVDRMKELATQAASDNVDDAGRGRIKAEYDALVSEIGGITSTTKFQGKTLLNGGFGNSVDTNTASSTALAAGKGVYSAKISGTAAGDYTITTGTAAGTLVLTDGNGTSQTVSGVGDGKQTISFSTFGVTIETNADFVANAAGGLALDAASSSADDAGTEIASIDVSGAMGAGTYTLNDPTSGNNDVELYYDDGLGGGPVVVDTISGLSSGAQTINFANAGISITTTASWDVNPMSTGIGHQWDVKEIVVTGGAGGASSADSTTIQVDAGANGGSFLVRSSGSYGSNDLVSLSNVNLTTGASGLNLDSLSFTGNGTASEWQSALTRIDSAIGTINSAFGTIGAAQNRIEYAMQNTNAGIENLKSAESVIRDVDMAAEVTSQTKFSILQQAAQSMLAQANSAPQGVLRLLG